MYVLISYDLRDLINEDKRDDFDEYFDEREWQRVEDLGSTVYFDCGLMTESAAIKHAEDHLQAAITAAKIRVGDERVVALISASKRPIAGRSRRGRWAPD